MQKQKTIDERLGLENPDLLVEMYPIEDQSTKIIKVIGVGGGGSNAVKNMYAEHPNGVRFAVCNTDSQALASCTVPVRIQLGEDGLGVGGVPEKGREAAEMSKDATALLFDDETRMVFITAGMGGGTGTGASPIIARQARDRGILTIGIVTLPFAFERRRSIDKALRGLTELRRNVDAILVINNERLLDVYSDGSTTAIQAFKYADDILTNATLSIAEIITREGIINCDFCDVQSTMKDGGAAIISVGYGTGDKRIFRALHEALNSPLLTGIQIEEAHRLLCIIYSGNVNPVKISEFNDLQDFMEALSTEVDFIFGLYPDESLGDEVKVSIIASGFEEQLPEDISELREKYYSKKPTQPKCVQPVLPTQETEELAVENIEGTSETTFAYGAKVEPESPEPVEKVQMQPTSRLDTWSERVIRFLDGIFEEKPSLPSKQSK